MQFYMACTINSKYRNGRPERKGNASRITSLNSISREQFLSLKIGLFCQCSEKRKRKPLTGRPVFTNYT